MYSELNTISILPVSDVTDLKNVREICSEICLVKGFGNLEIKEIQLALSEACTNVLRFAKPGKVLILNPDEGRGIKIIVEDNGPGIDNISLALQDGYSTIKNSLGVGLGAIKRATDKFNIVSEPGKGTQLMFTKYVRFAPDYDFAVISRQDERYFQNGDICYLSDIYGDTMLIAVIDGLGEGEDAERSAKNMYNFIDKHKYLKLEEIIILMHDELKKDEFGGGAISLLAIRGKEIRYLGVGDTFGTVVSNEIRSLRNFSGIVGQFTLPNLEIQKFNLENGKFIIVLCTDGIKNKFIIREEDHNLTARALANEIMTRFRREFGDASVFVIKGENYD